MRRFILLLTMPFLFDAGVAVCLAGEGPHTAPPKHAGPTPAHPAALIWFQRELGAMGHLVSDMENR